MTRHYVRFLVIFSTVIFSSVLWIAAAQPPSQGPIIPTPTLYPVENISYTLDQVGGEDLTMTFDHAAANGITPGTTTVTSQYPRGMTFTLAPQSDNGEIQNVTLYVRYIHGEGLTTVAEYDAALQTWSARLWELGDQTPAWAHFDFDWEIRDTSGATLTTEPEAIDYWDPSQVWFRMESDAVIVYWYGVSEDNPDFFARTAAEGMAATELRRLDGFGQTISYKPIVVVYRDRAAWDAIYASGMSHRTAGGKTMENLGMAAIVMKEGNVNFQATWGAEGITHESTHLYQYDMMNGNAGPLWWQEGQAMWFSRFPSQSYDFRLMRLAALQDIPSLTTNISRELLQADGAAYLNYDMGASFINWFVATYGIDSHKEIVVLMQNGTNLYDAIQTVTGEDFLDIENAWRIYLGYRPLTQADIDPASALQPAIDPVANTGDTVTLPTVPATVMLYEEPGQNQPSNGVCFANTPVEILAVGSLDGVDYYQVNCMGQIGWMSRGELIGPEN